MNSRINPKYGSNIDRMLYIYDSVFGKRVLIYLENRGTPEDSNMNGFRIGIENYTFSKRGKPHIFKNI